MITYSHRRKGIGNPYPIIGSIANLAVCFCLSVCRGGFISDARGETLGVAKPLEATADSWPLFRGDAQAQGVAKSPLPDDPQARVRLGCSFVGLPGTVESRIQRYINEVQRARRALE